MRSSLFAERLKELRKTHSLSQKALASHLDLSPSSICEWENLRSEPNIESLSKMSDLFECSIDYLVGREDDLGNIVVQSDSDFATSPAEQRLVLDFRRLPPDTQSYVIGIVKNLAAAS